MNLQMTKGEKQMPYGREQCHSRSVIFRIEITKIRQILPVLNRMPVPRDLHKVLLKSEGY